MGIHGTEKRILMFIMNNGNFLLKVNGNFGKGNKLDLLLLLPITYIQNKNIYQAVCSNA